MKIKISLHKIWRIPVFLFSWRSSQGMRCENSPEYGEVIRLKKSIQTKKCEMWNQIMSQKIPIFHFTFRLGRCARCDVFPSERLARLQLVTWQELLSDSLLGGLSSSPAPCLSLSLLPCPLSVSPHLLWARCREMFLREILILTATKLIKFPQSQKTLWYMRKWMGVFT